MIDKLNKMYRNTIRLAISGKGKYKSGATRFGGVPDVPADFIWPTFETSTYEDKEIKMRPLSFIAQFNCNDLMHFDYEGLLPTTGVLSFFYEVDSQRWGFDPKDAGSARVYWFKNINELNAAETPKDLPEECQFPILNITLTADKVLPDYEDFILAYPEVDGDYDEYEEKISLIVTSQNENQSKLLGWPFIIQSNMTSECELVSRGFYLGNGEIPTTVIAEAKATSLEDWCLLLQLDTVEDENFELMFGDCGNIYFYIRKEDLQVKNFDNIWLILQCY